MRVLYVCVVMRVGGGDGEGVCIIVVQTSSVLGSLVSLIIPIIYVCVD